MDPPPALSPPPELGAAAPGRTAALVGAATALGFHLPYAVWIALGPDRSLLGDARTLVSVAALGLLLWMRRPRPLPVPTAREADLATLAFALAAVMAAAGIGEPLLWVVSWPLVVIAATAAAAGGDLGAAMRRNFGLVVLAAALFPFERYAGVHLDRALQTLTARCAAPLVSWTGLPVHVAGGVDPTLVGEDLWVTVTSLCAGAQTLLSLLCLGVVVAELFLERWEARLIFMVLAPGFGLLGNVVRVALSTHAAERWGADPRAWALAHDLIGYATFAVTYGVLFVVARRLRRVAAPRPLRA
jgi:exosortase/archaeosortase family protein